MRIAKLVVFCGIAIYTAFFGIGDITGTLSNYSIYNNLMETKSTLAKEYENVQVGESEALTNMENHFGKTAEDLKDKEMCTSTLLGIDGVKLVDATAYNIIGDTVLELSTVDDATSINNFDHTVNCIEYRLKVKDLTKAVNGIKKLNMCVTSLTADKDNNTVSVRVLFLNESGGAA